MKVPGYLQTAPEGLPTDGAVVVVEEVAYGFDVDDVHAVDREEEG